MSPNLYNSPPHIVWKNQISLYTDGYVVVNIYQMN